MGPGRRGPPCPAVGPSCGPRRACSSRSLCPLRWRSGSPRPPRRLRRSRTRRCRAPLPGARVWVKCTGFWSQSLTVARARSTSLRRGGSGAGRTGRGSTSTGCRSCSCAPPLEVTGSKVDGTSKKRVGVIVASHAVHTCIFGDAFCGRYQGHLQRFFETFQDEWFRVNSACFDPTA